MKKTSLLSLAATGLLLSSCALGPAWNGAPEMPVPAEFRGAGISESNMSDLAWQEVMDDANLQALLNDVMEQNGSLEAMQHNVEQAYHYVTMAAAPIFPWFNYGANTTKGANSSGAAAIAQMGGATSNPGSMALNASWELDIWGKTRKGIESAEASADSANAAFGAMRISMLRQAACGYLQLVMLDEQLTIAKEAVASYRESLELFQAEQEVGTASGIQTAAAQAALSAAEAQVPALESQIAGLENTLSALAGRTPGHIHRSSSLSGFAKASKVAPGIPAQALARRPDIRAKEFALRAANAEVGVAIASYFPTISLTGVAGYASMDLRHHMMMGKHSGWGIGANLAGPLFHAGQLTANKQMKKDAFLAAKAEYEQSVLDALAEVSTTLIQREKLNSIISKQEEAVAAYQENLKLARIRFRGGEASYYEILDAQKGLFPAQMQLASYRYQYAACIPTLYTQLGGGWK